MNQANGCERVLARLEEHLDGGLTALEAARDGGHLEVCATCAHAKAELRSDLQNIRAALTLGGGEFSGALAGVTQALDARMQRGQAAPGRKLRALRSRALVPILTAAAAVLLLVFLDSLGLVPDASQMASIELPEWNITMPNADSLGGLSR